MTRFCMYCGERLTDDLPIKCENCDSWTFVSVKPAASAVIIHQDTFLAVRRAKPPAADQWDIPGGFCDGFEHPTETAQREVLEETGLQIKIGPLIGIYVGDYEYQQEIHPTLSIYYFAELADPASNKLATETTGRNN